MRKLLFVALVLSAPLTAATAVPILWHSPGAVEKLDFAAGPGGRAGAPKPPFTFLKENLSGTSPKIQVTDASGRMWNVKWGPEVHSETFASRIAWACGYTVEPAYFVSSGKIIHLGKLKRAGKAVDSDGSFANARFELWDRHYKFLKEPGWSWVDNPFLGTRELNGLKIVILLVSNWDNKDARDLRAESNTAILERKGGGARQWRYFVTDWGASMGKWGGVATRSKWDCAGFAAETPKFVKGVLNGYVQWGYVGKHTEDATTRISVADVRWILKYLGRISNRQIMDGLRASGATEPQILCFTEALRARIDKLRAVAALTDRERR